MKSRHAIQANDFQMSCNNTSLRECPICHEKIQEPGSGCNVNAVFLRLSGQGSVLKQGVDVTAYTHVKCFAGQMPVGVAQETFDYLVGVFPGLQAVGKDECRKLIAAFYKALPGNEDATETEVAGVVDDFFSGRDLR